jgi:hypothetical protein
MAWVVYGGRLNLSLKSSEATSGLRVSACARFRSARPHGAHNNPGGSGHVAESPAGAALDWQEPLSCPCQWHASGRLLRGPDAHVPLRAELRTFNLDSYDSGATTE